MYKAPGHFAKPPPDRGLEHTYIHTYAHFSLFATDT